MNTEKNCPKCRARLKIVPAGVAKMSGKPYPAFYVCPSKCALKGLMDTRVDIPQPPKGWEELGKKLGVEPKDEMKNDVVVGLLTDISAKLDKVLDKQGKINTELGEEEY